MKKEEKMVNQSSSKWAKPDVKYNDFAIQRLINSMMWDGKKTVAEKIVYDAIDIVMKNELASKEPSVSELMKKILNKVKPYIEVVSRRVRGATYPVPMEIKHRRAEMLALRWIRDGARNKGGEMKNALAYELLDALNDKGYAIKQRDQVLSMAKANRAFAHFGGSTK
jgi:small subunit ribosomal protein S7